MPICFNLKQIITKKNENGKCKKEILKKQTIYKLILNNISLMICRLFNIFVNSKYFILQIRNF